MQEDNLDDRKTQIALMLDVRRTQISEILTSESGGTAPGALRDYLRDIDTQRHDLEQQLDAARKAAATIQTHQEKLSVFLTQSGDDPDIQVAYDENARHLASLNDDIEIATYHQDLLQEQLYQVLGHVGHQNLSESEREAVRSAGYDPDQINQTQETIVYPTLFDDIDSDMPADTPPQIAVKDFFEQQTLSVRDALIRGRPGDKWYDQDELLQENLRARKLSNAKSTQDLYRFRHDIVVRPLQEVEREIDRRTAQGDQDGLLPQLQRHRDFLAEYQEKIETRLDRERPPTPEIPERWKDVKSEFTNAASEGFMARLGAAWASITGYLSRAFSATDSLHKDEKAPPGSRPNTQPHGPAPGP